MGSGWHDEGSIRALLRFLFGRAMLQLYLVILLMVLGSFLMPD